MQPSAKSRIETIVYGAVEEVNKQLRRSQRLGKSPDTIVFGEAGGLDSLGLVNLVVLIEQKVEEELSVAVRLADDEALRTEDEPFRTLGSLIDYLERVLEKSTNE